MPYARRVQEGDLCSVRSDEGGFVVAKVLKLEEGIVHIRVYAKKYAERPTVVAGEELTLGTVFDEDFGLGHLPLDADAFAKWDPKIIRHTAIEPEELEGYEIWREAEDEGTGGVWGGPEREGIGTKLKRLFRRD
jgi:hypothetical protein